MPSEQPKIDNGGPAFPVVETHPVHGSRIDLGMSLRDYFAGQALANSSICNCVLNIDEKAERAWMMADAMLKWRQT